MIKRKEFNKVIDNVKEKLDDTTQALVSEDLLATKSAYSGLYDDYKSLKLENDKLKQEKEELLKVNGSLYQKIGFEREEESKHESILQNDKTDDEKISIDEVIDKNGNFIV